MSSKNDRIIKEKLFSHCLRSLNTHDSTSEAQKCTKIWGDILQLCVNRFWKLYNVISKKRAIFRFLQTAYICKLRGWIDLITHTHYNTSPVTQHHISLFLDHMEFGVWCSVYKACLLYNYQEFVNIHLLAATFKIQPLSLHFMRFAKTWISLAVFEITLLNFRDLLTHS